MTPSIVSGDVRTMTEFDTSKLAEVILKLKTPSANASGANVIINSTNIIKRLILL